MLDASQTISFPKLERKIEHRCDKMSFPFREDSERTGIPWKKGQKRFVTMSRSWE